MDAMDELKNKLKGVLKRQGKKAVIVIVILVAIIARISSYNIFSYY